MAAFLTGTGLLCPLSSFSEYALYRNAQKRKQRNCHAAPNLLGATQISEHLNKADYHTNQACTDDIPAGE
jgi:hypothetical protein